MEPEPSARISTSSTLFFSSRDLHDAGPGSSRAYTDDDLESWFDLNVDTMRSSGATTPDHCDADGDCSQFQFQFQLLTADLEGATSTAPPTAVADELFRSGRIVPLGELMQRPADGAKKSGEQRSKASDGIDKTDGESSGNPPSTTLEKPFQGVVQASACAGDAGRDVKAVGGGKGNARSGSRRGSTGAPEAVPETATTQQSGRVWTSKKPPKPKRSGNSSRSPSSFLNHLIKLPSESIRLVYLFFVRPTLESPSGSSSPRGHGQQEEHKKQPKPFHGLFVPFYRLLAPNGQKARNKESQRVVFELGGGSTEDVLEAMRLSNASSSGRWRDARSPAGGGSRPTSRPGSPLSSPQHRGAWGGDMGWDAEKERKRLAMERASSISSAIAYCKGAYK